MRPTLASLLSMTLGLSLAHIAMADSEYESWLKANSFDAQAAQQEFQDYMDANDKEFVGFLKQQWKKVELKKPIVLDKTPKPSKLPVAKTPDPKPQTTPHATSPIASPIISKPRKPEPIVKVQPIKPVVEKIKPAPRPKPLIEKITPDPRVPQIQFEFLARTISMPKVKTRALAFNSRLNSKSIAKHWESMATQKHKHIIQALNAHKANLNLNDWAVALLANQYSKEIGLYNENAQQLFTWFLLVKSGYDVRLAYNSNAFVLMPSEQALFGVTYFTMNNQKYYAVSFDTEKVNSGRAYTYSGKHDSANKNINFGNASRIKPSSAIKSKALSFKFNGGKHKVNLDYDLALVQFSNTLPQMNIQYYPQQGLPKQTAEQLLNQLKPLVQGKSEVDAVNLLLRFVQTSFAYKTDGQQFNKENYLLPIETLHYPYSDCEDRASIFSWLTESLLGLDAVLLDYPGHIAAAVHFNDSVDGDNLHYNGKTYTVTDPTYINARVGMAMPQFKGNKPKVLNF